MIRALLFLMILCLFAGSDSIAQINRKIENLPNYENKRLHFGFLLGFNSADFRIRNRPEIVSFDSVYVIQGLKQSGFNLGIISDLHLGELFDLRFVPTLSFASRKLEYVFYSESGGQSIRLKDVESTFIDFPILFKYKSRRYNNFRAYVIGGIRYSIDMASQKDVKPEPGVAIVKLDTDDYGFEIGTGFDFYANYFKFSPELRLFFGVKNLLVRDATIYSKPIDRLTSKILQISFNFE